MSTAVSPVRVLKQAFMPLTLKYSYNLSNPNNSMPYTAIGLNPASGVRYYKKLNVDSLTTICNVTKKSRNVLIKSWSSMPLYNYTFDKGRLKSLVSWSLKTYGEAKTIQLLENLKRTGFQYATKAGISLGVEDLKIPPKKAALLYEAEVISKKAIDQYNRSEITGVERFQRLIDTWHRTSEQLKQEVIDFFEITDILNPVYMMAFSGARGNISQVRQLVGMRGLMSDPKGQIIDYPIRSNFREGLTITEYIISSYGARKGIVDTALRTANAGYLTRRLVDVAQHVVISNYDCGTKQGIFLTDIKEGNKTIFSLQTRLLGRVLARDILLPTGKTIARRNDEITAPLATLIPKVIKDTNTKVFVRSPLTCETQKLICQLCYGWSLAQGNLVSIGEAVGIVAAQSIGEPGTQLTMRTFHTGGVFSGDTSDQIRAPYNGFVYYPSQAAGTLTRTPEGKIAFLTKVDGLICVTLDKDIFASNDKLKVSTYKIPAFTLLYYKSGDAVTAKQVIAQVSAAARQGMMKEDAALTVKSAMQGQLIIENLKVEEQLIGPKFKKTASPNTLTYLMEKNMAAWNWGYAWVLSCHPYKMPMFGHTEQISLVPQVGDFVNNQTIMSQIKWVIPPITTFIENTSNKTLISSLRDKLGFKLSSALGNQRRVTAFGIEKKEPTLPYLAHAALSTAPKKGKIFEQLNIKQQLFSLELNSLFYNQIGYFASWAPRTSSEVATPSSLGFVNMTPVSYGQETSKMYCQGKKTKVLFLPTNIKGKLNPNSLTKTNYNYNSSNSLLPGGPPDSSKGRFGTVTQEVVSSALSGIRATNQIDENLKSNPFKTHMRASNVLGSTKILPLVAGVTRGQANKAVPTIKALPNFYLFEPLALGAEGVDPTIPMEAITSYVHKLLKPTSLLNTVNYITLISDKGKANISELELNNNRFWRDFKATPSVTLQNYYVISSSPNPKNSSQTVTSKIGKPTSSYRYKRASLGFSWLKSTHLRQREPLLKQKNLSNFSLAKLDFNKVSIKKNVVLKWDWLFIRSAPNSVPSNDWLQGLQYLNNSSLDNVTIKEVKPEAIFSTPKNTLASLSSTDLKWYRAAIYKPRFFPLELSPASNGKKAGINSISLEQSLQKNFSILNSQENAVFLYNKSVPINNFFPNLGWQTFQKLGLGGSKINSPNKVVGNSASFKYSKTTFSALRAYIRKGASFPIIIAPSRLLGFQRDKSARTISISKQLIFWSGNIKQKISLNPLAKMPITQLVLSTSEIVNPSEPKSLNSLLDYNVNKSSTNLARIYFNLLDMTPKPMALNNQFQVKEHGINLALTNNSNVLTAALTSLPGITSQKPASQLKVLGGAKLVTLLQKYLLASTLRNVAFSATPTLLHTLKRAPWGNSLREARHLGNRKFLLGYFNQPGFEYNLTFNYKNYTLGVNGKPFKTKYQISTTTGQPNLALNSLANTSFFSSHVGEVLMTPWYSTSQGVKTKSTGDNILALQRQNNNTLNSYPTSFLMSPEGTKIERAEKNFECITQKRLDGVLGATNVISYVQKQLRINSLNRSLILTYKDLFSYKLKLLPQIVQKSSNPLSRRQLETDKTHYSSWLKAQLAWSNSNKNVKPLKTMLLPVGALVLKGSYSTNVAYESRKPRIRKGLEAHSLSSAVKGSIPEGSNTVFAKQVFQRSGQIIHLNERKVTLRKAQPLLISARTTFHSFHGDFVKENEPVITLIYQKFKTGDIIQGIPKVEQFFEARTTKRGRLFRENLPNLLKGLFLKYYFYASSLAKLWKKTKSVDNLGAADNTFLAIQWAVKQSFYKIQQIAVDGVLRVYRSQGVSISDKHLEIIVKQMTTKVRIISGGQTGFFPGELVDFDFVQTLNKVLIKKILYEPVILGITKASLQVDSFLSAASFQQTSRILSQSALVNKKDFLKGVKENVIVGNLIPTGTGYLVSLMP